MSRRPGTGLATLVFVLAAACAQPADDAGERAEPSAASTEPTAAGTEHADEAAARPGDAHAGDAHGTTGEHALPLLPIMQRLGADMNTLTYALMTDDRETVVHAATAIAEHTPIAADEVERIRTVLGSDFHEFETFDASVHDASVRLREAAESQQLDAVVEQLGIVQSGCVACHGRFRERLRADRLEREETLPARALSDSGPARP